MAWPLNQDYNEAIQDPRNCLGDPELREGEVVCNTLGLPRPHSGNFADVYEFQCPGGGRYAVKCFTREVRGLQARYQAISDHLHQAKLPFTVDFKYLEKGIQIRGQWYPILKMQWVEGFTLNEFVRNHLDKPAMLDGLLQIWSRMGRRLREANLAHGDLQHGNVLLVPGSTASSLAVKLIDYDGMHVPALEGKKSGEVGHPAYQHPQRLREGHYNSEVDRFPLLLIATALRCLVAGGRDLWERYDTGDNLLFREADLREPASSELFAELNSLQDPLARKLIGEVQEALGKNLDQAPLLEEVLPEARSSVAKKPAVSPALAAASTPVPEPVAVSQPIDFTGGVGDSPAPRSRRRKAHKAAAPLWPVVALASGGAALLLVGAVVAWSVLSNKPQTPKTPPDNSPPVVAQNTLPVPIPVRPPEKTPPVKTPPESENPFKSIPLPPKNTEPMKDPAPEPKKEPTPPPMPDPVPEPKKEPVPAPPVNVPLQSAELQRRFGMGGGAKVSVEGATFRPLFDAAQLPGGNKPIIWGNIPNWLKGSSFSAMREAMKGVVNFKVESDGVVLMATTTRWGGGGNASGGWKQECRSKADLENESWCELTTLSSSHGDFMVFGRLCRKGETFRIRTEKYVPPIVFMARGS